MSTAAWQFEVRGWVAVILATIVASNGAWYIAAILSLAALFAFWMAERLLRNKKHAICEMTEMPGPEVWGPKLERRLKGIEE